MAQWSKRARETTRHEYVLPNPSNTAELQKAWSAAYADYKHVTGKPVVDDSVWITHADDEIIIYWEEKK